MKPQAKLLPGDIGIIVGMLAVLGGAIWLPIVLFSEMPHYSALKRDGRTVIGQIVGKHSELSAGLVGNANLLRRISFSRSASIRHAVCRSVAVLQPHCPPQFRRNREPERTLWLGSVSVRQPATKGPSLADQRASRSMPVPSNASKPIGSATGSA